MKIIGKNSLNSKKKTNFAALFSIFSFGYISMQYGSY